MPRWGREKYIRQKYTTTDLAYLAGIVDGEGSISMGSYAVTSIGTPQFTTYLSVTNTNKDMIDWLVNKFGTKSYARTAKQLAKNSRRPVWLWQITGDRLLHICEEILPYIVAKRRQVEIMIEMRKTFTGRSYKVGQRGPKISDKLLEKRRNLVAELRSLHIRTASIKHD
jgi:hypothetical protein